MAAQGCSQTPRLMQPAHMEAVRFDAASGVQHAQHNQDHSASAALLFTPSPNLRLSTSSPWPRHCMSTLTSTAPLSLHVHTHPSHSQTSRLLSTSPSLDTTFPLVEAFPPSLEEVEASKVEEVQVSNTCSSLRPQVSHNTETFSPPAPQFSCSPL